MKKQPPSIFDYIIMGIIILFLLIGIIGGIIGIFGNGRLSCYERINGRNVMTGYDANQVKSIDCKYFREDY